MSRTLRYMTKTPAPVDTVEKLDQDHQDVPYKQSQNMMSKDKTRRIA